jgi:hypothetical protein
MSVVIMDGRVRVYWLTAIPANLALPTVAELNAGLDFTPFVTPDGLDISWTTGKVNVGNVGSTFGLNRVGRREPDISVTFHHDQSTGSADLAWSTTIYRALGVLVVRTGVDKATAWTVGQGAGGLTGQVEVYPVEAGEGNRQKPAPDTSWDFTVPLTVYLDPSTRSVVA